MISIRTFLAVSVFGLAIGLVHAQGTDTGKLDRFFDRLEETDQAMGSIAISEAGRIVYQRAIGYASVEDELAATPATQYRIGSVTKAFTATLIHQLVDGGKLTLETTLDEFFPGVERADEITIAHLLGHRSGIFNYTNRPSIAEWIYEPITSEALLDTIVAGGSNFDPGTEHEYSNSNYVLLTWIAERLWEEPYGELIQTRICEPCGLTETYAGGQAGAATLATQSYTQFDEWEAEPRWDLSIALGAGNIISTAAELNTFLRCLLRGDQLVSADSRRNMIEMQDGMGLGVYQVPFYEQVGYGHNGLIEAFESNAFYFPASDVAVTYLGNGMVYPINDIIVGALSIYFGKEYEIPEFAPEFEVSTAVLDTYVGVYAAEGFPLEITIERRGGKLAGQATGEGNFLLKAVSETEFHFDQTGVILNFLGDGEMQLNQGGMELIFTRKE